MVVEIRTAVSFMVRLLRNRGSLSDTQHRASGTVSNKLSQIVTGTTGSQTGLRRVLGTAASGSTMRWTL